MDIIEANKIFNVWRKWFWPCHDILFSIFSFWIPESFLPYPIDVLNKALTIIANNNAYKEISKDIIGTRNCLMYYTKDEDALQFLKKKLSMPGIEEAMLPAFSKYKKNWINWLEKLEKQEEN